MSEEEKEAIDDLKLAIEQEKEELPYSKESLKNKQAILNYIDKLQKELEEYKNLCLMFSNERDKIIKEEMELQKENEELKENSISKDIIRDKIKELGSIKGDLATYIAVIEKMKILNELLGEKTNE